MKVFKKIVAQEDQRIFFCSDIHGEIDFLLESLEKLSFIKGKDLLICAGDLIDRGADSFKTARFFCNDSSGSFHSVIGNHDLFAIDMDFGNWLYNGGSWMLDELPTHEEKIAFSEMLKQLPIAIEVERGIISVGVTHACVPYEFEMWSDFIWALENKFDKGLLHEIVWNREFVEYVDNSYYKNSLILGVDFTVHGHTPLKKPLWVNNRLHIDTGLVYNGKLTIAELKEDGLEFNTFKKEK